MILWNWVNKLIWKIRKWPKHHYTNQIETAKITTFEVLDWWIQYNQFWIPTEIFPVDLNEKSNDIVYGDSEGQDDWLGYC